MTNAFTVNPAAPRIDVRSLQTTANLRAGSTKGVETQRDLVLHMRRSAPVEGREAGQRSADKRDALKRGGR